MSKKLSIEIKSKNPISSVDITKPLFAFNIETKVINDESIRLINARDLHTQLQVGRDYSNWIKDRIEQCSFILNQDFIIDSPNLANQKGRGGDRRTIEYYITIDMAKHLAMLEKNEIGHQARQYFISIEKSYNKGGIRQVLISDLMLQIPREWEKTFNDEFFQLSVEMVTGNEFDRSKGTPSCIGNFINKYIYGFLDQDIVRIAKQTRDASGVYGYIHQFLDAKFGAEALKAHINVVIHLMKASSQNYDAFKSLMKILIENKKQSTLLLN